MEASMNAFSGWSTGSSSGGRLWRVAAALVVVSLAGLLTASSASAHAAWPPRIAVVTGQEAGWPDVRGWNSAGLAAQQIAPWGFNPIEFSPYATYQHGVRVAVGDVNGDGRNEIVTAPGQGGFTELRVFDGTSYKQLGAMLPFKDAAWWNGAFVATGDVNGDGRAEIVDGLDAGCCTTIHVVDPSTGAETSGFFPYGNNDQGGVQVATADLNGDGKAEILAVPVGGTEVSAFGPGGGNPFKTYDPFGSEAIGGVSIAAGDVLGDKQPELVAAASTPVGVQVKVIDTQSGAVVASLFPYAAPAVAPPQVAVADVNGDGRADIIVLAQLGDGTQVKVLDADGTQLDSFYVLEPGIVPGASLSAGDLNGDGKAEIVIGGGPTPTAPSPDAGNGPDQRVVVYHGDGTVVGGFTAYPGLFQGGVRVALADVNGDGRPDTITAPGPGTEPEIGIYSQRWLNGQDQGTRLGHFLAYESSFNGGVSVAAGYWSGTPRIVVAPGPGRAPEVRVFDPQGHLLSSFLAFDSSYTGGLSVAVGELQADAQPEIVVGTLAPPARIQAFSFNGQPLDSLIAPFPADDANGVQVGVADLNGTGNGLIVAGETTGANPLLELIDPTTGTVLRTARPEPEAENGLRVGTADLNLDGRDEILVAPAWASNGPLGDVLILGPDLRQKSSFSVYNWSGAGMTVAGAARNGLPLRADAVKVRLIARKRTRFVVARFHDAAGPAAAGLHATIRWGDATSARGTVISYGPGDYDVRGTKRYARTGAYTITVTLTDSQHRISIAHSTARVRNAR
jgi:hypothetical protein